MVPLNQSFVSVQSKGVWRESQVYVGIAVFPPVAASCLGKVGQRVADGADNGEQAVAPRHSNNYDFCQISACSQKFHSLRQLPRPADIIPGAGPGLPRRNA
jgi:hypothetical protein